MKKENVLEKLNSYLNNNPEYQAFQNQDLFTDTYETMLGLREKEAEVKWVKNAFAEGSICAAEYEKMREAYERVCQRLGAGEEDADLDMIVESMENIQKELCRNMYALMDEVTGKLMEKLL